NACFKKSGILANPQRPLLMEVKVQSVQRREFFEERHAGLRQCASQIHAFPHGCFSTSCPELPQPRIQNGVPSRPDVERTFGIKHPLDPLREDSRGRQRFDVTQRDQTGVAVGTTSADLALVNHRDARALPGQVEGAANSYRTSTDDESVNSIWHVGARTGAE